MVHPKGWPGTALESNQRDQKMGRRWGTAAQGTSNKHLLRKNFFFFLKRDFIRLAARETPDIYLCIACYALS